MEYEESLAILQTRHTAEMKDLVEQLHDIDAYRQQLLTELSTAREKTEALQNEVTHLSDVNEEVGDLKRKFDRDVAELEDASRKTATELQTVSRGHW